MTIFIKIIRIFFSLFILVSSSTSLAATFNYYLLNSGDSVRNPINVTGYFEASRGSGPECDAKKSFTDIKVSTGQQQILIL